MAVGSSGVIINNASGGAGHFLARYTLAVGNAPSVNSPPSNQTVLSGSNVTFTVVATGDPTLVYQWSLGANALADDNVTVTRVPPQPTLTLNGVTSANAGNYFVAVTNAYGVASAQGLAHGYHSGAVDWLTAKFHPAWLQLPRHRRELWQQFFLGPGQNRQLDRAR